MSDPIPTDHDRVAELAHQLQQGDHGFMPKDRLADAADVATIARTVLQHQDALAEVNRTLGTIAYTLEQTVGHLHTQTELQRSTIAAIGRMTTAADKLTWHLEARERSQSVLNAAIQNGAPDPSLGG